MDDLNLVRAGILLISGIPLTFYPRVGMKFQDILLRPFGVKYRDSEKSMRNLGVVLILIAAGLLLYAGM